MSRIFVLSDLHLSVRRRDDYRFSFLDRFNKIVDKERPEAVLLAGDLTEEKDRHPAELVNKVVRYMHDLAKLAPLVILKANHDYKDESHPFFAFLSSVENICWIGEPCNASQLPATQFRKPFAGCLFLPHTHNPKRDWKGIIDKTTFRFVFTHQLYSGAVGDTGKRLSGVDPSLIPKNQYVLSGDVHAPGKVGDNIEYIGAPYHVDFGDAYKSRFIEIKSNSSSRQVFSRYTNTWPQKRLIEASDVDKLFNGSFKVNAGDIVAVRVGIDSLERWTKVRAKIQTLGDEHGCVIHRIEPVLPKKATRRHVAVKADVRVSDGDVVRSFCKRHGLDERLEKVGLSIAEDVR